MVIWLSFFIFIFATVKNFNRTGQDFFSSNFTDKFTEIDYVELFEVYVKTKKNPGHVFTTEPGQRIVTNVTIVTRLSQRK